MQKLNSAAYANKSGTVNPVMELGNTLEALSLKFGRQSRTERIVAELEGIKTIMRRGQVKQASFEINALVVRLKEDQL